MMTPEQKEAMDEFTVYEVRLLAMYGLRAVTGNGQLVAIVSDDKETTKRIEKLRCDNGY